VVLKKLQTVSLMKNINERGKQLKAALTTINKQYGVFEEIRGRGLMIGAELKTQWQGKAGDISELGRKNGLLVLQAGPNVVRFLPPLVITEKEMKEGIARFQKTIAAFLAQK